MAMQQQYRDWSHAGAMLRWQHAAEQVIPNHVGTPLVQHFDCVIDCSCGWRGIGPDWLQHLNESIHNAIQD